MEMNIDTIAQRYDAGHALTQEEREHLYYLGHAHSDYMICCPYREYLESLSDADLFEEVWRACWSYVKDNM